MPSLGPRQSALAGQIAPIVQSLNLSRNDLLAIVEHLSGILCALDLVVLFGLGWLLVPYTRIVHSFFNATIMKNKVEGSPDAEDEAVNGAALSGPRASGNKNEESIDEDRHRFERTYLFFAADSLSQIARLALLVYACDCLIVALEAVGYNAEVSSRVFAKILYTSWFASRIQCFKRCLIRKILSKAPKNCDKIKLIDRVLDGLVYALLVVKILDYLSVETGMAIGSIFAVGSTGTLIISLGSQEIAKGIVNGVEMASSDRFYEGDNVHFGDGTQGHIVKMGFLRTKIQKYDSTVLDIPNAQLGGQRVINISRTKISRVVTTLRFEYKDVQKIPEALALVKEEIAASCPKLIVEKKPFRAVISGFERDHVEATVSCSFEVTPMGEEFCQQREQMYLAIDRGVSKSEIRFARPIYQLQLQGSSQTEDK